MSEDCLFCKIVNRTISADEVARNDHAVAFRDISPQAPTHVLVVPVRHIANASELGADDAPLLSEVVALANDVTRIEGLDGGYRLVMNVGDDAGNSVPHLHMHVLGGRALAWPPG